MNNCNSKDSPPLRIKDRLSNSSAAAANPPTNRLSSSSTTCSGISSVSSAQSQQQNSYIKTGGNVSASVSGSTADAGNNNVNVVNGVVAAASAASSSQLQRNSSGTQLIHLVPAASSGNVGRPPPKKQNEENNEASGGGGTVTVTVADNNRAVAGPAECQPQAGTGTGTVTVPKRSSQVRRFHRLFRSVPINEDLLKRYSCAFVSDLGLLLQGHLYVSYDWICFHSNIFGIEKIIEIPVHSIATISKSRTAKIIPNAVCVRTHSGKQYAFGSLLSRDSTHQLLSTVLVRTQQSLVEGGALIADVTTAVDQDSASKISTSVVESNKLVESAMLRVPQVGASVKDIIIQPGTGVDDNGSSTSGATTDDGESSDDLLSNDDLVDNPRKSNNNNSVRLRKQGGATRRLRRAGATAASSGADPLNMCSGNVGILSCLKGVYKFCLQAFFTWFLNLPKILMVLVVCVILLGFLFLCATVLTVRLIYLQNPHSTFLDYITTEKNIRRPAWTLESLERMNSVVESSLNLIEDVKKQLEILKNEMHKETVSRSSSQTNDENLRRQKDTQKFFDSNSDSPDNLFYAPKKFAT